MADEPIPATGSGDDGTPDHPRSHDQDDSGQVDITMDLETIHRSPSSAALAGTTLGQALRSVEQWSPVQVQVQEPSEQEIADVTSRANQLLATTTGTTIPNAPAQPTHRSSVSTAPPSIPAQSHPLSKAMNRREIEAWELEKQQIRQKLELEREDRRDRARISARELHLESIKAFRELLRDGLTKNEAGRMVWQEAWPTMRRQMSEEDG